MSTSALFIGHLLSVFDKAPPLAVAIEGLGAEVQAAASEMEGMAGARYRV